MTSPRAEPWVDGVVIDLRDGAAEPDHVAVTSAVLALHHRAAAERDWPLAQAAAEAYRLLAAHAEPPAT